MRKKNFNEIKHLELIIQTADKQKSLRNKDLRSPLKALGEMKASLACRKGFAFNGADSPTGSTRQDAPAGAAGDKEAEEHQRKVPLAGTPPR